MYSRHSRSWSRHSKRSTRLGSLYVKRSNLSTESRLHILRATLKNNSRAKSTMRRLRWYRAMAQFPLREKMSYVTLRKPTRKWTSHRCLGKMQLHTLTQKDTPTRTMTISLVGYRKPHGLHRHSLQATKSVLSSRAVTPHTHTVAVVSGSEVGRLRLRASPVRFCACRLYPLRKYLSHRRPYHPPTRALCRLRCAEHAHARISHYHHTTPPQIRHPRKTTSSPQTQTRVPVILQLLVCPRLSALPHRARRFGDRILVIRILRCCAISGRGGDLRTRL